MRPTTDRPSLVTALDGPLRSAVRAAKESVWLASPFITGEVCEWLSSRARRSGCEWRLLTELDAAAAAYGSLNLNGVRALIAAGVNVRHLDNLHAKLFLTEAEGFTGSANLTAAGLGTTQRANAELSVVLDDAQRRDAHEVYAQWWRSAMRIGEDELKECEQAAAKIPVRISRPPHAGRRRGSQVDKANRLLRRASESGIWVKAVYQGDDDYPWDSPWVSSSSKGKPSFAAGDVLMVYAVYAKTCYTVVEVLGETTLDVQRQIAGGVTPEDANRWPWVTDVKVLLEVPPADGVPLSRMGLTGLSLRNGHCRMPIGGLAAALTAMTS